jgi:hypothetical protein
LSRYGNAKQIFNAWGTAGELELQRLIDRVNTHSAIAVHVDMLFEALKAGVSNFFQSAYHSELLNTRAEKLFSSMPPIQSDK